MPGRKMSPQSLHILSNLHRVVEKPYKLQVNSPRRRSQLDGVECSAQITSLVVGGFVSEDSDGMFTRTPPGISAMLTMQPKAAL